MKILSIHDLQIIRKRAEHNLSLREESNEKFPRNVAAWRPEQNISRFLYAEVPVVKLLPVKASRKIFKKPLKETGLLTK